MTPEASNSTALLLDVGSTWVKGSLVTRDGGSVIAENQARIPDALSSVDTRHEVDPVSLHAVVTNVVEELLAGFGSPPSSAIMSAQMHSSVLTDSSGTPLSPLITWRDDRLIEVDRSGGNLLEQLIAQAGPELWASSGMARRPGIGAGNIGAWLRENRLPRHAGIRIHTLGSYLSTAFGGPYVTGLSSAASLGLVDVRTRTWSSSLIGLHGLSAFELPEILPAPGPIGTVRLGGAEVSWWGDIGDHQASILGSGGLSDDEIAISLGTAGIAARLADEPSSDPRVDSRPYFDGRYLLAVSRQPGGALATEFSELLSDIAKTITGVPVTVDEVWEKVSASSPPTSSRTTLELGEGSAGTREFSFSRIQPASSLSGMYGAFLNHYVDSYHRCMAILFPMPERQPMRVKFNGGLAAKNHNLRIALAKRLAVDIDDSPSGEFAVLGLRELMMSGIPRQPA